MPQFEKREQMEKKLRKAFRKLEKKNLKYLEKLQKKGLISELKNVGGSKSLDKNEHRLHLVALALDPDKVLDQTYSIEVQAQVKQV
jgi:hypothetical protein